MQKNIKFCTQCSSPVEHRIPDDGDTRVRALCPVCGHIQYQNPLVVVGTLPVWQQDGVDTVLLCKRNIEPQYGKWTLPAGFLECGETALTGALRETWEEAGIGGEGSFVGDTSALRPFTQPFFAFFDVLQAGQIYLFYRIQVLRPTLLPGYETMEARYFSEAEIPWDEIAFSAVREVLQYYFKTIKQANAEQVFNGVYQKTL